MHFVHSREVRGCSRSTVTGKLIAALSRDGGCLALVILVLTCCLAMLGDQILTEVGFGPPVILVRGTGKNVPTVYISWPQLVERYVVGVAW